MFEKHFDAFVELLDSAISLNPSWKPIPPAGKVFFFKAMSQYSLDQVSSAMTAHIRDTKAGMFQPTPAHLIAKIENQSGGDGRPNDGEAWAIALTSQDEADTVVWTAETAEAFAICRPVLAMGDEVGARMAFKDAYNRLVTQARAANKPASWHASLGWDMNKREAAIQRASVAGLLAAPVVHALLPNHAAQAIGGECPEGLKRVKEEMAKLQAGRAAVAQKVAAEREAEREAERRKKANIAAQVEAYLAGVSA